MLFTLHLHVHRYMYNMLFIFTYLNIFLTSVATRAGFISNDPVAVLGYWNRGAKVGAGENFAN